LSPLDSPFLDAGPRSTLPLSTFHSFDASIQNFSRALFPPTMASIVSTLFKRSLKAVPRLTSFVSFYLTHARGPTSSRASPVSGLIPILLSIVLAPFHYWVPCALRAHFILFLSAHRCPWITRFPNCTYTFVAP